MKHCLGILLTFLILQGFAQDNTRNTRFKAAKAIESYVKKKLEKKADQYEALDFGPLNTLKPQEYVELEDLLRLKKELPGLYDHYGDRLDSIITANDSMIQAKKKEIMVENIRVSYEMYHVFQLNLDQDKVEVHSAQFFLDYQLNVKNIKYNYRVVLTEKQSRILYHYLMRFALVETGDARQDQLVTEEIYDYFERKWIKLDYDTDFLKHMLNVFHHVYKNGYLDVNELGQNEIDRYINEEGVDGYRAEKFSPMYTIEYTDTTTNRDTLIGYKMFHLYSFKDPETEERIDQGLYFEFDRYYMIKGVFRLEKPYDQYFQEDK